jgi:hypothetical protein
VKHVMATILRIKAPSFTNYVQVFKISFNSSLYLATEESSLKINTQTDIRRNLLYRK